MAGPNTLHPGSELWSGLVSVHQALGETAELRLDLLRSKRTQLYYQRYPALWYDNRTSNTAALLSPTVEFALPGSWTLSLGGTWKIGRESRRERVCQYV